MGMNTASTAVSTTRLMGPAGHDRPGRDARWLHLPAGLVGPGGERLHEVRVRELTGADEEAMFDRASPGGAAQVSTLLARLIEAVPGHPGVVDEQFTAALQLGDRDYLLLRLRQLDLGDAVHQVARCPHCAGKVDVDLLISELPLREPPEGAAADGSHRLALGDAQLQLRLPTGDDQQAVEALASDNPSAANTRLFSRLVLDVDGRGAPSEDELRRWPIGRRQALATWLQQHLPGPDLFLDLSCPHCRADMSYAFDLHSFFLPSA